MVKVVKVILIVSNKYFMTAVTVVIVVTEVTVTVTVVTDIADSYTY